MNLPIPMFWSVREVICLHRDCFNLPPRLALIAPDPTAGRRNRYSLIVLDCATGQAECRGRELTLAECRRIAEIVD